MTWKKREVDRSPLLQALMPPPIKKKRTPSLGLMDRGLKHWSRVLITLFPGTNSWEAERLQRRVPDTARTKTYRTLNRSSTLT